MKQFNREHHQLIWQILSGFDQLYLKDNGVLFGGGTRIAMELDEFRESVDIDFFCSGPKAYKAVRNEVTNNGLGRLLSKQSGVVLLREVRADRDAVRTFVSLEGSNVPVKLEFIYYDLHPIAQDRTDFFHSLGVIDRKTCYVSKLLANADRFNDFANKDFFDLCMMQRKWGDVPKSALRDAVKIYGSKTIVYGLEQASKSITQNVDSAVKGMVANLKMDEALAKILIDAEAQKLFESVKKSLSEA